MKLRGCGCPLKMAFWPRESRARAFAPRRHIFFSGHGSGTYPFPGRLARSALSRARLAAASSQSASACGEKAAKAPQRRRGRAGKCGEICSEDTLGTAEAGEASQRCLAKGGGQRRLASGSSEQRRPRRQLGGARKGEPQAEPGEAFRKSASHQKH